ncbi:ferredoxin/adrenodoxin reductase [Thelephora ganbajun]|uniref:Ferredoxin/adrenodoxin reductase n=1 Tax=Thelephora ganbajun TaxID=370292 RepID=A0ACB6ZLY2_THEGA|nr:ferredoxin/adrenodoxin reductase [Thelephora ganbajun]
MVMNPLKVAIVGGGPSSFYVASRLLSLVPLKSTQQLRVHVYDRLWSPYGLVRYGVAPDHPEVKNCAHKFDDAATDSRLKFFGNVNIGGPTTSSPSAISVPIESLLAKYTHLVLGSGCAVPVLHPELPPSERCIPALDVVHWYTNHPSKPKTPPIDNAQHVSIIGQGNVSLDIARILLSRPEDLRQHDIPERVLAHLAKSTVKRISIIGRRGPYEVAFTAKELRELLDLPGVVMDPLPSDILQPKEGMKPTRQQSRIVSLLQRGSKEIPKGPSEDFKSWSLEFFRSPIGVVPTRHSTSSNLELSLAHTTLDPNNKAVPTGATSILPIDLIVTSLGHRSEPTTHWYDPGLGHVRNVSGRVVDGGGNVLKNVYTSGWASTGAKGVLATTMMNAYDVAQTLLSDARDPVPETRSVMNEDIKETTLDELPEEVKRGLESSQVITHDTWKRIDDEEVRRGAALGGKERERMDWTEVDRYLQKIRVA